MCNHFYAKTIYDQVYNFSIALNKKIMVIVGYKVNKIKFSLTNFFKI